MADNVCHELEALQAEFAQEWLFFRADPGEQKEITAYESAGLAVQPVNIRHHCLNRFERGGPIWHYTSGGIDMNAIDFMRQRWPLDYKLE